MMKMKMKNISGHIADMSVLKMENVWIIYAYVIMIFLVTIVNTIQNIIKVKKNELYLYMIIM